MTPMTIVLITFAKIGTKMFLTASRTGAIQNSKKAISYHPPQKAISYHRTQKSGGR
jgi:hypothetical protein